MDPMALTKAQAKRRYGSPLQLTCRSLLGRINSTTVNPLAPLAADVPTVTIGTTATLTARLVGTQTAEVAEVGSRGTWSSGGPRQVQNGFSGLDFGVLGDAVEIDLLAGSFSTFAIFVDGRPIASAVTDVGPLTAGTRYYLKLAFGSVARRRIEVFASHVGGWYGVRGAVTTVFAPAPRRPVVAFLGDSFYNANYGVPQIRGVAFMAARMLGVEPYMSTPIAASSTGYTAAGSAGVFGSTARLDLIDKGKSELIVVQGSLNDDAAAVGTIQAAATQLYADLATRRPLAPVIVIGPQPSNGAGAAAGRAGNNAAVRAAALAAPNVIAFFDQIGTSTGLPATYAGATAYTTGDLVRHLDSVWRFRNDGLASTTAGAPSVDARWELVTWAYFGTGRVGTTTGNGTRDVLLYSDGTHPSELGALALGGLTDEAVRRALTNYAATGQRLVA